MKKLYLLFFIIFITLYGFVQLEKEPKLSNYQITLPYCVYNKLLKGEYKNLIYSEQNNDVLHIKAIINYRKRGKKQYFLIKYIYPQNPIDFPITIAVEILHKKNHYILFPKFRRYILRKNSGLINILAKQTINIEKKFVGNRVYNNKIFFKYPFNGENIKGFIYKSKKGKILEIDLERNKRNYTFIFDDSQKINTKFAGKYLRVSTLEIAFNKKMIITKSILEKEGDSFGR